MKTAFKKTFTTISAAYLVIGLMLVIWPTMSSITLIDVAGAGLIVIGLIKAIRYLSAKNPSDAFDLTLIKSAFLVLIGIVIICKAKKIIELLGILFGIGLVFTSLVRIQLAINLSKNSSKNWAIIIGTGIAMLIYGVILLVDPFKAIATANIFAGIGLIIDAVSGLLSVFWVSKAFKEVE